MPETLAPKHHHMCVSCKSCLSSIKKAEWRANCWRERVAPVGALVHLECEAKMFVLARTGHAKCCFPLLMTMGMTPPHKASVFFMGFQCCPTTYDTYRRMVKVQIHMCSQRGGLQWWFGRPKLRTTLLLPSK